MDDASAEGEGDQNWAACDRCGMWRRTNHSVDETHSFSCASVGRDCSEPCDGCRQHECVCPSDDEVLSGGDVRDGSEFLVSDDDLRALSECGAAADGDGLPQDEPSDSESSRYDGLRERYEKLELKLEQLDRSP